MILACFQCVPTLPGGPRRDPIRSQQVVCLAGCAHYVVNPWLRFVFLLVLWYAVEGRVAVGVLVAFFLLVGVLWVGVKVVWFIVGRLVDAGGVRSCGTSLGLSLRMCDVFSSFLNVLRTP